MVYRGKSVLVRRRCLPLIRLNRRHEQPRWASGQELSNAGTIESSVQSDEDGFNVGLGGYNVVAVSLRFVFGGKPAHLHPVPGPLARQVYSLYVHGVGL